MDSAETTQAIFDWLPTIVGLVGVVVGAASSCLAQILVEQHRQRRNNQLNSGREKILREMLENPKFEWRKLSTLASVIGCDEEATKDLLIAIEARGSEKEDGLWGLQSRHSLAELDQ